MYTYTHTYIYLYLYIITCIHRHRCGRGWSHVPPADGPKRKRPGGRLWTDDALAERA